MFDINDMIADAFMSPLQKAIIFFLRSLSILASMNIAIIAAAIPLHPIPDNTDNTFVPHIMKGIVRTIDMRIVIT